VKTQKKKRALTVTSSPDFLQLPYCELGFSITNCHVKWLWIQGPGTKNKGTGMTGMHPCLQKQIGETPYFGISQ
jgi:hypothetical protein